MILVSVGDTTNSAMEMEMTYTQHIQPTPEQELANLQFLRWRIQTRRLTGDDAPVPVYEKPITQSDWLSAPSSEGSG